MFMFQHYRDEWAKVGRREKSIIGVILFAAFFLGAVIVYQYTSRTTLQLTGEYVPPAPATLTLTANPQNAAAGDVISVALSIDTKDTGVEAADFVLKFDPKVLSVNSIETGNFFKNYPRNEKGDGTVSVSGVADFDGSAFIIPKGAGKIATITFWTLSTGTTTISLDPEKTIVAAAGKNIAETLPDVTVTIQEQANDTLE